ncbi:MAG TPA: zf-HC2 domain-containing protein [Gemmatimonadaceae bacterium]
MSDWSPRPQGGTTPEEEAAREAQHQLLIDLLAAYLDAELPAETRAQIEAHLVGCARCRRELRVQHEVRRLLGSEPLAAAPPTFQARIAEAIAAAPIPAGDIPRAPARRVSAGVAFAATTLLVVLGLGAWAVTVRGDAEGVARAQPATRTLPARAASVPLFADVLADYRRVAMTDLPGRSRDLEAVRSAMPFAVEALRAPGLRLVGAWTTELGGEPAAVLAYRVDDRVVLQYLVSEERFFRHPAVRNAVADGRPVTSIDGGQVMVAWPARAAGVVVVGELAPERMSQIPASDRLARRGARGAE